MSKYDYNRVSQIAEDKKCKLDMTEDEFKSDYKNLKSSIKIISVCGHPTTVIFNNFLYLNTGVTCRDCINNSYKETKPKVDYHVQEFKVINGICKFCSDDFEFKICGEGCMADFVFKPKDVNDDLWLPIQVKTTQKVCHGLYSFTVQTDYKNMNILFFAIEDQRIWIINYEVLKNLKRKLNIGAKSSIYDKYEVMTDDLSDKLHELYDEYNKSKLQDILDLSPELVQKEKEFMKLREEKLPELKFNYPEIDNRVYDVIINNRFKVQDKVITMFTKDKTNIETYIVNLHRSSRRNAYQYALGDNDYYWLYLPDKKGAYILSENVLFDNDLLSDIDVNNNKRNLLTLHPYKTNVKDLIYGWMNDYLYWFDKDIEKIYDIFNNDSKDEYEIADEYIMIKGSNKHYVRKLVKNMFQRIIENNNKPVIEEDKFNMKLFIKNIFKNIINNNKILCKKCNIVELYERNKTGYCETCYSKAKYELGLNRKVERPPYEQLKAEVRASSYVQVGKKYGVSDNCIRKWIKMYEKYES